MRPRQQAIEHFMGKVRLIQFAAGAFPLPLLLPAVLLIAGIGGAGWYVAKRQVAISRGVAERALTSIADLKAGQIETWMKERRGDAAVVRSSMVVQQLLAAPDHPSAQAAALEYFRDLQQAYDYHFIAVFDSRGGLLLTTSTEDLGRLSCAAGHVQSALRAQENVVTDLHRGQANEPIHFSLLCPIRVNSQSSGPADGVVLLIVDPFRFLYPFVQTWPVPSQTGETLLVRREGDEVVYLNETRHRQDMALNLRLPVSRTDVPAVRAALGQRGLTSGLDYRAVPVAAVVRAIAGTSWLMVAKLDQEEIDAPIRRDIWRTASVFGLASLAGLLGIVLLGRQQRLRFVQQELAERQRVETALRAREEVFSSIVNQAVDAITLVDGATGGFVEFNAAAHEGLGYTREEFSRLTIADIQAEHSAAEIRRNFELIRQGGGLAFETRHRRRDGEIRDVRVSVSVLHLQGRDCMAAMWSDITDRKKVEAALRTSEARFRALFDQAVDGIMLTTGDGKDLKVNPAFARMHGYDSPQEMECLQVQELDTEAFAPSTEERLRRLRAGETLTFEVEHYRKDRSTFPLSVTASRVELGGKWYLLGFHRDITERKRAAEALQQQNEEIVRFTYTVSHDLRSPLVTIQTFIGYLEKDLEKGDAERVKTDFGYIRRAATKMHELLEELLELSRIGRKMAPPEDVPFDDLVQAALDAVAGRIAERRVQVDVAHVPLLLHGDRRRLTEVFQNLLDNAAKFMGGQPAPRIAVGVEEDGREPVFYVRDNGLGIDPRHQGKLFGLFEKLHPDTPGTGMGLALVKRIVEVHGGRIWVESAGPGQGTTFRFTLQGTKRHEIRSPRNCL